MPAATRITTAALVCALALGVLPATSTAAHTEVTATLASTHSLDSTSAGGSATYKWAESFGPEQGKQGKRKKTSKKRGKNSETGHKHPVTGSAKGSPNDWAPVHAGHVDRWDPCTPVTYGVNDTGAYDGFRADLDQVLDEISKHTGLTFVYAGKSTQAAWSGSPRGPKVTNPDADRFMLLISWATARQVPDLRGWTAGVGGFQNDQYGFAEEGGVSLDLDWLKSLRKGGMSARDRDILVTLLRHELGHAVGLGHARQRVQVMFPSADDENRYGWGAGDLTGLHAVGTSGGCRPAPVDEDDDEDWDWDWDWE